MSNLAKALGVAEGQEFDTLEFPGVTYRICGGRREIKQGEEWVNCSHEEYLVHLINHPEEIHPIPQYTPEVIEAAKAAVLLGYEWMAIDDDKTAYMYVEEPTDGHRRGWFTAGGYYGQIPSVALNNFPLGKYNLKEIAGV